jgi:hypothetical protein
MKQCKVKFGQNWEPPEFLPWESKFERCVLEESTDILVLYKQEYQSRRAFRWIVSARIQTLNSCSERNRREVNSGQTRLGGRK